MHMTVHVCLCLCMYSSMCVKYVYSMFMTYCNAILRILKKAIFEVFHRLIHHLNLRQQG